MFINMQIISDESYLAQPFSILMFYITYHLK